MLDHSKRCGLVKKRLPGSGAGRRTQRVPGRDRPHGRYSDTSAEYGDIYAGDDPINSTDPDGRCARHLGWACWAVREAALQAASAAAEASYGAYYVAHWSYHHLPEDRVSRAILRGEETAGLRGDMFIDNVQRAYGDKRGSCDEGHSGPIFTGTKRGPRAYFFGCHGGKLDIP